MAMNFVTFNQDFSCLAVGTSKGFRIHSTEPFAKTFTGEDGDVAIIEMLFSTSLVALVRSPRHLVIQNTKKSQVICELTFPSAILAVRLNKKRLAIILEDEIYLYDISTMKLLQTIPTSPNPSAICALSPSEKEHCYLAYPLPKTREDKEEQRPAHAPRKSTHIAPTSGEVLVVDSLTLKSVNIIPAHKRPLSCIALNREATLLATASATGTVIRVFSLPTGDKLYQFRRGSTPASIYSMSFNLSSTLLCVSSTSDTVHIFRLGTPGPKPRSDSPDERRSRSRSYDSALESPTSPGSELTGTSTANQTSRTFGSMFRSAAQMAGKSAVGIVGGYLPQAVTEMWEPERDFAFIKLPKGANSEDGPIRSVVAMSSTSPQVMVVTSDGGYYIYNIDMETGGEGMLVKQHSVLHDDIFDSPTD